MLHAPRIFAPLILLLAFSACQVVSETGRRQLVLFSEAELATQATSAYEEVTGQYPILRGTPQARMVERIGRRIAAVVPGDYDWEFRLLDAPQVVNAFAMPGGKCAVYTGLLSVATTEEELAAVMGHEIAHVTARHGNERASIETAKSTGLALAGAAVSFAEMTAEQRANWMTLIAGAGVAGQYVVTLPFSRSHESEADEIGLRYLVRAGYDPEGAPRLWEKMAELGSTGPSWLSTHPNPLDRAQRLREITAGIVAEEGGR